MQALLDDIEELKPTIFLSVPRLWNRIYDKWVMTGPLCCALVHWVCKLRKLFAPFRVMAQVNHGNPVARSLFHMAYSSKKTAMEKGDLTGGRAGAFWDRLVFSKVGISIFC